MAAAKGPGPFVQFFEVDSRALGTGLRSWKHDRDGKMEAPASLAFACPCCGQVWARCPVALPGGRPERYQFIVKACRQCPTTYDRGQGVYGSLYDATFDMAFVEAFPPAVWQRELEHYLSLYP